MDIRRLSRGTSTVAVLCPYRTPAPMWADPAFECSMNKYLCDQLSTPVQGTDERTVEFNFKKRTEKTYDAPPGVWEDIGNSEIARHFRLKSRPLPGPFIG